MVKTYGCWLDTSTYYISSCFCLGFLSIKITLVCFHIIFHLHVANSSRHHVTGYTVIIILEFWVGCIVTSLAAGTISQE